MATSQVEDLTAAYHVRTSPRGPHVPRRRAPHRSTLGRQKDALKAVRMGTAALSFSVFVCIALYSSILLEETARQVAHSQGGMVPQRAKILLNFLGTGKLGHPLLCRLSRLDEIRSEYHPELRGQAYRMLGFPCNLIPLFEAFLDFLMHPSRHRKTLILLGTPMPMLQQQQLIAAGVGAPLKDWKLLSKIVKEIIPVVIVTSHVPNDPYHPALVAIKQARKLNSLVYVVGPNPNLKHLSALGVRIEGRAEYNETFSWADANLQVAKIEFARLWFLQAFMRRHKYNRVFSISADVMLYANVSEMVTALYPATKVALPVRWPSMQPPPLPSQFTSTSVSPHAGLWHKEALDDFITLYKVIIELNLFGGKPGIPIGKKKEYQQDVVLGWYVWSECWTNPKLDPPCMAEPSYGISLKLGRWLAKKSKFRPKFLVESLCQPRQCHLSAWSDEELCVFDNSFSVASQSKFFKFGPKDKCPQSKLYEHYHAWMGQSPRKNVQFLGVNFQGTRRDYLKLEDSDPSKTWGSAVF